MMGTNTANRLTPKNISDAGTISSNAAIDINTPVSSFSLFFCLIWRQRVDIFYNFAVFNICKNFVFRVFTVLRVCLRKFRKNNFITAHIINKRVFRNCDNICCKRRFAVYFVILNRTYYFQKDLLRQILGESFAASQLQQIFCHIRPEGAYKSVKCCSVAVLAACDYLFFIHILCTYLYLSVILHA